MEQIKVIFTDIDGVFNSEKSLHKRIKLAKQGFLVREEADWPVEPMVGHYNRIIEATGAKIVISSTWRLLHPLEGRDETKSPRFKEGLKEIFQKCGIKGEIIGKTPQAKLSGFRGLDIQQYLEEHPEVIRYVIIDDNSDMLEEQKPYFVQTTWERGLEEHHANKAIEILNKE